MKIVSRFKDYYDFIGHRFGADPDCTYVRGKVPSSGKVTFGSPRDNIGRRNENPFDRVSRSDEKSRTEYEVEYVIAGALVFPVVRVVRRTDTELDRENTYDVTHRLLHEDLFIWMSCGDSQYRYYSRRHQDYVPWERAWEKFQDGVNQPAFTNKCRELLVRCQVPVIKVRYDGVNGCVVHDDTPILKDHGVASEVGAGAMWQNIYSTMTNVMRSNPDKDPPVEICNNDRISKAGFDLKTSFRHPVNQKKVRP